MKCAKCGTEFDAGAKFCSQCGAAGPDMAWSTQSLAEHTPVPQAQVNAAPPAQVVTRQRTWSKKRTLGVVIGGLGLFACVACLLVQMFAVITSNPEETEADVLTSVAQAATRMPAGLGTRASESQGTAIAQDLSVPTPVPFFSPNPLPNAALTEHPTPTANRLNNTIPLPANTIAPPTAKFIAVVTATETASTEATALMPGEIVLNDNFDVSPAQALFGSNHMSFVSENGQGVLTGNTANVVLPAMYDMLTARDFIAEFDLIPPLVPTGGSYGLVFRSDDAPGGLAHYYLIVLNAQTNRAAFMTYRDGTFARSDTAAFAPGLLQSGKTNRVRVQAADKLFRADINGVMVYNTRDVLLPNAGYFGLAMLTGSTVPDTARFDNLLIYANESTQIALAPSPTAFPTKTLTREIPTPAPTRTRAPTRVPPTPTAEAITGLCPNPAYSVYWSDDFSNPPSGWTNYTGADYSHFYKDGEWHFAVTQKNKTGNAWILLGERSLHQAITVRAWKLEGPNLNSYGLIYGGQNDENYYAFRISDSGSYRIAKLVQGQWQDLIPWTKTAAIHQGGVNELALFLDGAQMYACVNGQLVGMTSDATLQPGRVGMVAGAYDEPTHIHFDDFAVWNLQEPVAVNPDGAGTPATPVTNAPPGIYVTALHTVPDNPKRNQDVSFAATFLNTTGASKNLDWLVLVYQPDAKKAFGETAAQGIAVPPGVSEFTSASNWTVRGPGGCLSLCGVPHMQNPDASRTPLNQPNGSAARVDFSVCP